AFPIIATALDESRNRRAANLKNGGQAPDRPLSGRSGNAEGFAEEIGIGRTLIFQAQKVHELFQDAKKYPFENEFSKTVNQTLSEHFEPLILEGEIGLGACLAGIAGLFACPRGDKRPETPGGYFTLIKDGWKQIAYRYRHWKGLDDATKKKMP